MRTTPSIRALAPALASAAAFGFACTMVACGGAIEAASSIDRDTATDADASDAAATDAGSSAEPAPPSSWQDQPSTLRPNRTDCLERPSGECESFDESFPDFEKEIEACDPGGHVCGFLNYEMDGNGCLSAIGWPPYTQVSGEKRSVEQCLAEQISKKRWLCAADKDGPLALNSCTLAK